MLGYFFSCKVYLSSSHTFDVVERMQEGLIYIDTKKIYIYLYIWRQAISGLNCM